MLGVAGLILINGVLCLWLARLPHVAPSAPRPHPLANIHEVTKDWNLNRFVILNGFEWDDNGELRELPTPYPGGNLFSLASGGAIYVRDPHQRVSTDQLNGGDFAPFTSADWAVVEPLLKQNEREFGIPVTRLLEVDGQPRRPGEVYRRIQPAKIKALQAEEMWVAHAKNS